MPPVDSSTSGGAQGLSRPPCHQCVNVSSICLLYGVGVMAAGHGNADRMRGSESAHFNRYGRPTRETYMGTLKQRRAARGRSRLYLY
jgi:hypothetical protein